MAQLPSENAERLVQPLVCFYQQTTVKQSAHLMPFYPSADGRCVHCVGSVSLLSELTLLLYEGKGVKTVGHFLCELCLTVAFDLQVYLPACHRAAVLPAYRLTTTSLQVGPSCLCLHCFVQYP